MKSAVPLDGNGVIGETDGAVPLAGVGAVSVSGKFPKLPSLQRTRTNHSGMSGDLPCTGYGNSRSPSGSESVCVGVEVGPLKKAANASGNSFRALNSRNPDRKS